MPNPPADLKSARAILIGLVIIALSGIGFAGAPPQGPTTLIQTGGLSTPEINASNAILNSTTSYSDYALKQNGASVFTSKIAGAIPNTLRLATGFVGIGPGGDPDVPFLIQGNIAVVPFATGAVIEPILNETTGSGYGVNGLIMRPEMRASLLGGAPERGIWVQNLISHTENHAVQELDGIMINGDDFTKTGSNAITTANAIYAIAPTIGSTNYALQTVGTSFFQALSSSGQPALLVSAAGAGTNAINVTSGESRFDGDIGDSGHKVPNIWVVTNHVGDLDFSNNWSLNETYASHGDIDGVQLRDASNHTTLQMTGEGTQLAHGTTQPPCDSNHRAYTYTLYGDGVTTGDVTEQCLRSATGTYAWRVLASG